MNFKMKKIIFLVAFIFIIFTGFFIYTLNKNQTSEENFNQGVNYFKKDNYNVSSMYFLKIKDTSHYYKEAQAYLKKIDSILTTEEKNASITDSINKRNNSIKSQFSSWDGSHIKLTILIKNRMNDPNSFEHVNTTYRDLNDKLLITTEFRGKNSFGGVVLNKVSAYSDLQGNIIEVISQ